jgi:four helix bundle protein
MAGGSLVDFASYRSWEAGVPDCLKRDVLWKMAVYRLAVFVGDLEWRDVTKLAADRRTVSLSDQLYRSLGSISSNFAEGYSRGTGRDRARFYEYSLGSAREARDWYFKGRYILGPEVTKHRLELLTEVIRLLLKIIPSERSDIVREERAAYTPHGEEGDESDLVRLMLDPGLIENIPLPDP